MKKVTFILLFAVILLMFAAPVLAQAGKPEVPTGAQLEIGFVALAMGIAAAGCGIAQGLAVSGGCGAVARNPGAVDTIRFFILLGLAFIEFLGLLTFLLFMMVPGQYFYTPGA